MIRRPAGLGEIGGSEKPDFVVADSDDVQHSTDKQGINLRE